jgi:hypothetical protein
MYSDARMVATERPRAPAVWRLATVLVALAVVSTLAWRTVRATGFGRPFKVLKITAEPGAEHLRSEVPAAGDRVVVARQSLNDVARLGAAVAAAKPVRRIDGTAFIASVEQASPLSSAQRTRLTNTFQLAAKLQATVDATDNPDTRADLQSRLDDQVRTRLRMILPKESQGPMSQVDEAGGPIAFEFRQNP